MIHQHEPPDVPIRYRTYTKNDGSVHARPRLEYSIMQFAASICAHSTCDRLQVGSVFTNANMNIILCWGYNGNFSGGPNECDDKSCVGSCGCLHSELNSIIKCNYDLSGGVCFVTTAPCLACSKILINRKIARVVYLQDYRKTDGIDLLTAHGIKVDRYGDLPDLIG